MPEGSCSWVERSFSAQPGTDASMSPASSGLRKWWMLRLFIGLLWREGRPLHFMAQAQGPAQMRWTRVTTSVCPTEQNRFEAGNRAFRFGPDGAFYKLFDRGALGTKRRDDRSV